MADELFGFGERDANEVLATRDIVKSFAPQRMVEEARGNRGAHPQKLLQWIRISSTTLVNGFYPGFWSQFDPVAKTWSDQAAIYALGPNGETLAATRYLARIEGQYSDGTPIYIVTGLGGGTDTDFWTGYENIIELFNTGSVTRYYPGGAVNGFVPTTLALVANQLYFIPFVAAYWDSGQTINAASIAIAVTSAIAGSHVRLGVFGAKYVSPLTGTATPLLFQSASLSTAATGLISAAIGSGVVPVNTPSAYFLALVADQAITVSAINGTDCYPIGGMDNTLIAAPVVGMRNVFAFGAMSAPWSFQSVGQTLIDANGKLPLIALRF